MRGHLIHFSSCFEGKEGLEEEVRGRNIRMRELS